MTKALLVIWLVYIFSLLDSISIVVVSRIRELIGFPLINGIDWCALAITAIYMLVVFIILYKKYREGIKAINYINILELTIFVIIDVGVALIMSTMIGLGIFGEEMVVRCIVSIGILVGAYVQLAVVVFLYVQCNIYKRKAQLMESHLNEKKQQYEQLEYRERETRKFRHDARSHMYMLSEMVKGKEYDGVKEYIEKLGTKIDSLESDAVVQK